MELDSSFVEPTPSSSGINHRDLSSSTSPHEVDRETGEASSKSFDSIYSSHAEALYEIRRACLLTSKPLCQIVKDILIGTEMFSGILNRRAAGEDGFLSGLSQDQDERMWQDWMDISQLNQVLSLSFFFDECKRV